MECMNYDHNNPIRMNHVGFPPSARKKFVIDSPACTTFRVCEYQYADERLFMVPIYEGSLSSLADSELPGEWHGDFSAIAKPGVYRVECGAEDTARWQRGRWFIVYDRVYEIPQRVLFNFFTWQRCGHKLGWAGECHPQDGVIKETGEHRDFTGGHHQSCDLRKSIDGVTIGMFGLIKYALLESPPWDDGCIADEIRWSCDYYRKLVHPDGFMYDGLFETRHKTANGSWGGRFYHNRPAAPSEQWHSIIMQACAAQYFRGRGDTEYGDTCLDAAQRVWNYMISEKRDPQPWRPPGVPPLGLGRIESFYVQVYKGSAADTSFRLTAAAELFRATGREEFLNEVADCANAFAGLQADVEDPSVNPVAACFIEAPGKPRIAGGGYGWHTVGPLSLCAALELLPGHPDADGWRACVDNVARQYALLAARNVWQRIPHKWYTEEERERGPGKQRKHLHAGGYFPGATARQPCFYYLGCDAGIGSIISQAKLLVKAARLLKQPDLLGPAQRQVDWILGANPYDASCVTGVGYNQLPIPMWALFPPIPQIPGGVSVTLTDREYEIPVAGQLLWLLSELSREYRKP